MAAPASACPGLMRIAPARDGGLCRIRLHGGELTRTQAKVIAAVARTAGSGLIDATNRANLQIRGVKAGMQDTVIAALISAGLGPQHADADDVRNLMLSPLAGIDPDALMDVTPLANALSAMMQRDTRLFDLSPKFALMVDGGERLAMLDHPHDVWLSALSADHMAFGFAGHPPGHADDRPMAGVIPVARTVPFVSAVLHAFLDRAAPGQTRMRDLLSTCTLDAFMAQVQAKLDFPLAPGSVAGQWLRVPGDPLLRFGAIEKINCFGAQIPLGRLHADTLDALADLAPRLRLTPWQSVLLRDPVEDAVTHLNALGLITDPENPLGRLIACAGSEGCMKSRANTKADAASLARLLPFAADIHLTGCPRSCAAAHRVGHTLLAIAPGEYDLYCRDSTDPVAHSLTIEQAAGWLARSTQDA